MTQSVSPIDDMGYSIPRLPDTLILTPPPFEWHLVKTLARGLRLNFS